MPSPSAIYSHLRDPIVSGVYSASVSLHIIFDGAGTEINDPGLSFDVYRSGTDPETGAWLTVFPGGDGTTEAERVHAGCVAVAVEIARRRGVELDPANVEYGGA